MHGNAARVNPLGDGTDAESGKLYPGEPAPGAAGSEFADAAKKGGAACVALAEIVELPAEVLSSARQCVGIAKLAKHPVQILYPAAVRSR